MGTTINSEQDFPTLYKEAAAVCIKNNSAAVYNEDTEKFECETLLERGSCLRPNEQRILIERPDPYKLWPSCQERCDDVNPYKLPFRQPDGPCVSMGDQDVCENSEVVKPTFYGYGNCSKYNPGTNWNIWKKSENSNH